MESQSQIPHNSQLQTHPIKFWAHDLSQSHSICNLSRGSWNIDGKSLHSGRTNVPGNSPKSCGKSAFDISLPLVFMLG